MKKLFLLAVFSLTSCKDTPSKPDSPPPPPEVIEPPPRVDQPFNLETYNGIIAFGLGHPGQSDEDILAFVNAAMGRGWNTLQICAETEFWSGPGYPTKSRDPERLRYVLDLIARVPGAQVALVGNCTLKRQVPLSEQFAWAEQVAKVASQFQNIAIFTHNEFDSCRGRVDWGGSNEYCPGKQDIAAHIRMYKSYGFSVVTADDSVRPRNSADSEAKTFTFRLSNVGAHPASFHPDREKNGQPWDPDVKYLTKLAKYNGLFIISEPVAWQDYSGRCNGLRTCNSDRIEKYISACAAVPECRWTFHCENCLAGEIPTWIPEAR